MPTVRTGSSVAPDWNFVGHYVGRYSVAPDWGAVGNYAAIADALMPVAHAVIDAAEIRSGEAVLDMGLRGGNWALLAAQTGGRVTGIDFSPGLLDRARAKLAPFPDARCEFADVARLPFPDASFDVAIDVLTLIFGADRDAAVAELSRVLKPDGRIVWSGWYGGDAIADALKIRTEATAKVLGQAPYPYGHWGDEDDMRALFGAHGFTVSMVRHPMVNTGASPREFLDGVRQAQPISFACAAVLEQAGLLEQTMAEMVAVLERRNEDPTALKLSREFVVGVARRR